jgi:hypothetical protein
MVILALLGFIVFVALIYGPQFWIKRIMLAHAEELPGMPGTGGELARHLLDDAGLKDVKVEVTAVITIQLKTRRFVFPKQTSKANRSLPLPLRHMRWPMRCKTAMVMCR